VRLHPALLLGAATLLTPRPGVAQVGLPPISPPGVAVPIRPPQPARYLLTAEVADARGLWVDPAGLARQLEASLGADLTADRFYSGGLQLRQWGATIATHGVGAGWVHDRYPDGSSLNSYAVGLGLGDEGFSAGVARRWYSGIVHGSAWDVGVRAVAWGGTDFSLLARNIGSPRLGDATYWATLVPGAAIRLLGGPVLLAGEGEFAPHGWRALEYRAGIAVALGAGLAVLVRADLAPDFKRRGLVIALDFEGSGSRVSGFALMPGGVDQVDAFGASAALVTRAARAGGR
jgi:hypothetical protein